MVCVYVCVCNIGPMKMCNYIQFIHRCCYFFFFFLKIYCPSIVFSFRFIVVYFALCLLLILRFHIRSGIREWCTIPLSSHNGTGQQKQKLFQFSICALFHNPIHSVFPNMFRFRFRFKRQICNKYKWPCYLQ